MPSRRLEATRDFEAIHVGHVHVEQDEVERLSLPMRASEEHEAIRSARREHAVRAPLQQHVVENAAISGVVVDDQHPMLGQVERRVSNHHLARFRQGRSDVEAAAEADFALQPDPAAHHRNQLRRDGEPEAGAAVLPRGRPVRLLESREDACLFLEGDADARIGHLEVHETAIAARRGDHDLALLRELDRVADQVHQHLADPSWVATEVIGESRIHLEEQLEALLIRPHRKRLDRVGEEPAQAERHVIEGQLACLDLREVEDVIDDQHQRLGALFHRVEILTLVRLEIGVEREFGHADDAVHRRPNLMRHVREELALRTARRFRRFLGGHELVRPDFHLLFEALAFLAQVRILRLDLREHAVEVVDQPSGLVLRPLFRSRRVHLGRRDDACVLRQVQDWCRNDPLEPGGQRERGEQRDREGGQHDERVGTVPCCHLLQIRLETHRADLFAAEHDRACDDDRCVAGL